MENVLGNGKIMPIKHVHKIHKKSNVFGRLNIEKNNLGKLPLFTNKYFLDQIIIFSFSYVEKVGEYIDIDIFN